MLVTMSDGVQALAEIRSYKGTTLEALVRGLTN